MKTQNVLAASRKTRLIHKMYLLLLACTLLSLTALSPAAHADNKRLKPKPGAPNTFTITICDDEEYVTPQIGEFQAHITGVKSTNTKAATAVEHGTNDIKISGHSAGDASVSFDISLDNGATYQHVIIEVHVIQCPKKKKGGAAAAIKDARLPAGAVYASAVVEPDTKIDVQAPGYALVANAEVVTMQRVQRGDRLDAGKTLSIQFDDGTGILVETAKTVAAFAVTSGLESLLDPHHASGLPICRDSATLFVGSQQPFASPALAIKGVNKLPDTTQAVFVRPGGHKVGALCTFRGLPAGEQAQMAVRVLDDSGATLQEGRIKGGCMDGTPRISFDRPVYHTGDAGELRIDNLDNYKKVLERTRFGAGQDLERQTMQIECSPNIRGLPTQAPFGTRRLRFHTTATGDVHVSVILPMLVSPQPFRSEEGTRDTNARMASAAFAEWLAEAANEVLLADNRGDDGPGLPPPPPPGAKKDLIDKWHKARDAKKAAEEAKRAAEEAKKAAETAKGEADKAQIDANKAKNGGAPDAGDMQKDADAKKGPAEQAKKDADKAQGDADQAQKDADDAQQAKEDAAKKLSKGDQADAYNEEAKKMDKESKDAQDEADRVKKKLENGGYPTDDDKQKAKEYQDKKQKEADDKKSQANGLRMDASKADR